MSLPFTRRPLAPHAALIRNALAEKALTLSDLSAMVGRPIQCLSDMMKVRRSMSPEFALEVETAIGIKAEDLLTAQVVYQVEQERSNQKVMV